MIETSQRYNEIIEIPGIPVSQSRMRACSRGGFTRMYDPREKEKKAIRDFLNVKQFDILEGHIRISFLFYMPIPESVTKKRRAVLSTGLIKHEKKPDVDNLIKLYLDVLDGILFHGDQRISLGFAVKLYSKEPKTVIFLQKTEEEIDPHELDQVASEFLGVSRL